MKSTTTTTSKTCSKCGVEKPLEDFSKSSSGGKFGRRAACKSCASKAAVVWARENKEKKRASLRRHYAKHASQFQEYAGVKHWASRLLKNAALSSEKRGLGAPEIDLAWILEQPMLCPFLGLVLVPSAQKSLWQPSLDRIDNEKGYTKENTRLTSLAWNLLRNDTTVEHALSVVSHIRSTKTEV